MPRIEKGKPVSGDDDVWCYHDCKSCADDFDNYYEEENSNIVPDNNDFSVMICHFNRNMFLFRSV